MQSKWRETLTLVCAIAIVVELAILINKMNDLDQPLNQFSSTMGTVSKDTCPPPCWPKISDASIALGPFPMPSATFTVHQQMDYLVCSQMMFLEMANNQNKRMLETKNVKETKAKP